MRFILALKCFFKVLFDGAAARRFARVLDSEPSPSVEILQAMQREGRLIDFLMEDIDGFDDGQVGAAVRSIHSGCRRALTESFTIEPVRPESEGASVQIPEGYDPARIRLVGNVAGRGPHAGVIKHHGWHISSVRLKVLGESQDDRVLAPAEVEVN